MAERATGPACALRHRPAGTGPPPPSAATPRPVTGTAASPAAAASPRHDIDHGQAFAAGGPTACWNLCCLCRRHHRIKTFARGWSFTLLPDGRLVVRTPSGISRTTRPPGWCHDPEPDPPWLEDRDPPDPLRP